MDDAQPSFLEIYTPISTTDNYHYCIAEGKCRICARQYPDVTFEKEAHLISQFLGSSFLLADECDECNALFSKWENDLAIFTRPHLVLLGIAPGNTKVPMFQSRSIDRNETTRSTLVFEPNTMRKFTAIGNEDYKVNYDKGEAQFTFRKPSFTPFNIYKIFLKMALELMPPETLEKNLWMCRWLFGETQLTDVVPGTFRTRLLRKKFQKPHATLYEAKNVVIQSHIYPKYTVVISFANLVFQFFLPVREQFLELEGMGFSKKAEIFPAFLWDGMDVFDNPNYKVVINQYDLTLDKKVTEDEVISLSFQDIQRNINSITSE